MVIEVARPAAARKDRLEKKRVYETAGVREYSLLDPAVHYAERFLLESDGCFGRGEVFGPHQVLVLQSLNGVEALLRDVVETPRRRYWLSMSQFHLWVNAEELDRMPGS